MPVANRGRLATAQGPGLSSAMGTAMGCPASLSSMHITERFSHAVRLVALPLIAALALTACAAPGGMGTGSDQPSGRPTPIAHPSGGGLVLRTWTAGGFVAPDYLFGQPPDFTLTGDGRVIEPGAVPAIYPGPAITPLLERRLTEAGVQRLIAEALGTGLFDHDRTYTGAASHIADAPTTTFTLGADGRTVNVAVYALGMSQGGGAALPADEAAAGKALLTLAQRLEDLSWLPADDWVDSTSVPYDPPAVRLLVRNADGEQPDPSGISFTEVAWPGPGNPATFGEPWPSGDARCGVVTGSDAVAWMTALRAANSLTRFVAGAHRYRIVARLLLPDEPRTCGSTGA